MKIIAYFKNLNKLDSVRFIKARARKDANTPYYHAEYQTTPVNTVETWTEYGKLNDYIILNDNQAPIEWLCGGMLRNGTRCMLIISPDDFALLYPNEQQRQQMIESIEKKLQF